jgi:hypothetical protein
VVSAIIFGITIGRGSGRDQGAGHQCRGPFLSSVTRAIGESFGGSSIPPQGLHSHGMPTLAQSQASSRALVPRQGRSGWFSQTQPEPSQIEHAISYK